MDINIDYDVRASPALEGVHAAETGADLRRGTEMGGSVSNFVFKAV